MALVNRLLRGGDAAVRAGRAMQKPARWFERRLTGMTRRAARRSTSPDDTTPDPAPDPAPSTHP